MKFCRQKCHATYLILCVYTQTPAFHLGLDNYSAFNMVFISDRDSLGFLKRGEITPDQVKALEEFLQSKGHKLRPRAQNKVSSGTNASRDESRIYFANGKNIYWQGFSEVGGASEREYKEAPQKDSHVNKITAILKTRGNGEFSEKGRSDIREGFVTLMKVTDIAIQNRKIGRSEVLRDDTEEDINAFVGFPYKEAIHKWTK